MFIPLAEELGLLAQLDMLILRKSLGQLVQWHRMGKYYSVHVNVSAPLIQQSLVGLVMTELILRNIAPRYLTLELTETTIIENTDLTREVIEQLSASGV